IDKGRIVADGTAATLRKQAQGKQVLQLRIEDGAANDIFEALRELETVELVDFVDREQLRFEVQSKAETQSNRDIFHLCATRNWVLAECIPLETKLEDIFRDLTVS
ncbi:MAG: gliding motility-associated ABC transporter ATP-binding subunit GldA, partial [Bacteroidota bacterium]